MAIPNHSAAVTGLGLTKNCWLLGTTWVESKSSIMANGASIRRETLDQVMCHSIHSIQYTVHSRVWDCKDSYQGLVLNMLMWHWHLCRIARGSTIINHKALQFTITITTLRVCLDYDSDYARLRYTKFRLIKVWNFKDRCSNTLSRALSCLECWFFPLWPTRLRTPARVDRLGIVLL